MTELIVPPAAQAFAENALACVRKFGKSPKAEWRATHSEKLFLLNIALRKKTTTLLVQTYNRAKDDVTIYCRHRTDPLAPYNYRVNMMVPYMKDDIAENPLTTGEFYPDLTGHKRDVVGRNSDLRLADMLKLNLV